MISGVFSGIIGSDRFVNRFYDEFLISTWLKSSGVYYPGEEFCLVLKFSLWSEILSSAGLSLAAAFSRVRSGRWARAHPHASWREKFKLLKSGIIFHASWMRSPRASECPLEPWYQCMLMTHRWTWSKVPRFLSDLVLIDIESRCE